MTLNEETRRFINQHRHDDTRTLALQGCKQPGVDLTEAIRQIAGRQAAETKIPAWSACDDILYPPHLSLEQCSSQTTADYKARLIECHPAPHRTLTDLTGGFGIDCAALAARFAQVTYVERQELLCRLARHNFPLLGLPHITVCQADAASYLQGMDASDWIYIDPARRDDRGGKTVAIGDCEPDVATLEPLLTAKARQILIKLSPMLDLTRALHDLRRVEAAHIVSVGNECKELLLVLRSTGDVPAPDDIPIHCANLTAYSRQIFTFTRREEQEAPCRYLPADSTGEATALLPGHYLYEPNASLLKAGAFRLLSHRFRACKLHPNSHLYTSANFLTDFPGRAFRITGLCGFGKKELKTLLADLKQANLTVRNFPASVAELRKRLKLAEGGHLYLFATTLADGRKVLIKTEKTIL